MMLEKKKRFISKYNIRQYGIKHPVCEICGRSQSEPFRIAGGVHHILKRSQLGSDTDDNLISLCSEHHTAVHDFKIKQNTLLRIKANEEKAKTINNRQQKPADDCQEFFRIESYFE